LENQFPHPQKPPNLYIHWNYPDITSSDKQKQYQYLGIRSQLYRCHHGTFENRAVS